VKTQMRLLDTIVLIASMDPKHPLYNKAVKHLQSVRSSSDVFVPCVVMHECEVVLRKKRKIPDTDIERIFQNLTLIIPNNKVIAADAETHRIAKTMSISGLSRGGYTDTMIASMAKQHQAEVVSLDKSFRKMGIRTYW